MELCEAHQPPIQVALGGSRSFRFSGGRQDLSRYFRHWIPFQRNSKITYLGTKNHLLGSQIMSIKKDYSVRSTCRNVCKVIWTIEADIADNQLLYITGDPAALGSWEPEKAIPLSPCKEQYNLWITETEVARGFIRGTFEVRPFMDDRATDEVAISRLRSTEGRSYIPSTKVTLFPVKKWKTRGK